jgi:hypothetical protein
MRRLRPLAATFLAAATVLMAASTVLAKGEDAIVTLDAPWPGDAQPGTELEIGWAVGIAQDDGSVAPFSAEGIFVRLLPASGDPVEFAASQDRIGHYVASITVPNGGIGGFEIGLQGTACTADEECRRADELFTIADMAVGARNEAEVAPPAPGQAGAGAPPATSLGTSLLPLVLAVVAVVLGAGLIARRSGRRLA